MPGYFKRPTNDRNVPQMSVSLFGLIVVDVFLGRDVDCTVANATSLCTIRPDITVMVDWA